MKPIKYFLIIIFFISIYNAITYADEEIKPNSEEYKLIKEYREITCAFIDKETDPKTQDRCFEITKKLFELTENKIFLTILARQYMHGIGVAKDLNKGLKFYEEVANSDSKDAVEAQDFLGLYYGYEDNPVKDEIKEEYWVKKAAYNGSLDAKCKLAILLRTGHRVEISRTEAYKLLYEAAEQDFAPAFQELSFYYKEDGNKEKANYWCYKFINSDVFKKVASGMDPVLALNQVYFEQKKKKYIEAQKELQETERANKNDS